MRSPAHRHALTNQPASQPTTRENKAFPPLNFSYSVTGRDARRLNISTATPLRTIHLRCRPIDLLRARAAKLGRRSAAVLTQVETDIDVCKRTNQSALSSRFSKSDVLGVKKQND